jgi:hypothetical protein
LFRIKSKRGIKAELSNEQRKKGFNNGKTARGGLNYMSCNIEKQIN